MPAGNRLTVVGNCWKVCCWQNRLLW